MLGEISSIVTIWDASAKVCKILEDKLDCYNYIVNLSEEYIKLCEEFKVKDLEVIKDILKKDKIKLLENRLNEASGDELKKILNEEILGFCETKEIKDCLENFCEIVLFTMKKVFPEKYNYYILNEKLAKIIENLEKINYKKIFHIEDELRRFTEKKEKKFLTLDFFDYEDKSFNMLLKAKIIEKKASIYLAGPSREELLYCLLYELKKINLEKDVYIFHSKSEWEKSEGILKNKILVCNFFDDRAIAPISNNMNIFLLAESDSSNISKAIKLERRLKENLERKLQDFGYSYEEINRLLMKTHGIFAGLKRELFEGSHPKNSWLENKDNNEYILQALLLGKWMDKDKEEIENIFDIDYLKFIEVMNDLSKDENPYVSKINYSKEYFLSFPEEAWYYLFQKISVDRWSKFYKKAIGIICYIDQEFVNEFNEKRYHVYDLSKQKYSKNLKKGLLRSLILYKITTGEDCSYIVEELFDEIFKGDYNNSMKWAYISDFIGELCEIAPDVVLNMIDQQVCESSKEGLIDLFRERRVEEYYIRVLWCLEQLLQCQSTSLLSAEVLIKLESLNIKYEISNSPKEIISHILSSTFKEEYFLRERKIRLAKKVINECNHGWDIILNLIPRNGSYIIKQLSKFRYSENFKTIESEKPEISIQIIKGYLNILIQACNTIHQFKDLIDAWIVSWVVEMNLQNEFLSKFQEKLNILSDSDKHLIQIKINQEIYESKLYQQGYNLEILKNLLQKIDFKDKIYKYKDMFTVDISNFPIDNPTPVGDGDWFEKNEKKAVEIIKEKFIQFKNEGFHFRELLDFNLKTDYFFGILVFEIYSEENLNEEDFKELLKYAEKLNSYRVYAFKIWSKFGLEGLKRLVEIAETQKVNINVLVELLKIQKIETSNNLIEEFSEEIKREYWETYDDYSLENENSIKYIVNNCIKYSNVNVFRYLDIGENIFSEDDYISFLEASLKCNFKRAGINSKYHIERIFEKIYEKKHDDIIKYEKIMSLEIKLKYPLGSDVNDFKSCQYLFRRWPKYYAELIKIMYKSEEELEDKEQLENKKRAEEFFKFYYKIRFCPCLEENGNIDFNLLKEWCRRFKEILKKQKQGKLYAVELGKLFTNTSNDKRNYYPHESICKFIQDMNGEELKKLQSSYEIAMYNKRGVYTSDAGKTESILSQEFKEIANSLYEKDYTKIAEVYKKISQSYRDASQKERERAIYE